MNSSRMFKNTNNGVNKIGKGYQFYQEDDFSDITSMTYLNNNQIAFTKYRSQFVNFLDLKTKKILSENLCNSLDEVRKVDRLPNGDLVTASNDNSLITVWNPNTYEPKIEFQVNKDYCKRINCLLVLQSGDIAIGSDAVGSDNDISIWDPQTGKLKTLLKGHERYITSLASLSTGDIVSSSVDKTLRIWDIQNGSCKRIISENESANLVMALPDDTLITFDFTGRIKIYEASTNENTYTYQSRPGCFMTGKMMPDGNIAFSDGDHLSIFDTKNRIVRRQSSELSSNENCFTVSPAGEIISATEDGISGYNESAFEQQNRCSFSPSNQ